MACWGYATGEILGPGALNLTKRDEEGEWATQQGVLGCLIDTVMEAISLPVVRVEGARTLFLSGEMKPGNMHIRVRSL